MSVVNAQARDTGRIMNRLMWAIAVIIGGYFIAKYVPHYFVVTEESYGPYFWPRAGYLLLHIIGGLVAILIGPFQFWSKIRTNYRVSTMTIATRTFSGS